jgi:protein SCO1/2
MLPSRTIARLALSMVGGLAMATLQAQDSAAPMDHSHHHMAGMAGAEAAPASADPHAAHKAMMADTSSVRRSIARYTVPQLGLIRDDGVAVSLDQELNDGRPVVLNFIFTTCTTICPVTSQIFSMLQKNLGEDRSKVHLVSISIDPEQDTPARLRAYATRFHAGAGWQHYTGTLKASAAAQQAFGVYQADKANHAPVTLVRSGTGNNWVRLDGFATANDLLNELRGGLTAAR